MKRANVTRSKMSAPAHDPCGLIKSFVRWPPNGSMTPNDVFVIWMLSHHHASTRQAAREVIDAYGPVMMQSASPWLADLLDLFKDMAGEPTMPAAHRHVPDPTALASRI